MQNEEILRSLDRMQYSCVVEIGIIVKEMQIAVELIRVQRERGELDSLEGGR